MREEKERLIEEVGVYFEKENQSPPLAARIYALMILCPNTGHNFDEIVELLNASKSSVSTNLNLLLENGSVEYFTKCGERKRYFRISRNYLRIYLKKREEHISRELKLMEKVAAFNCHYNQTKYEKHEDFVKLYISYLEAHQANLNLTIKKMNEIDA